MITKTQWDEICSYVYSAKIMGLHPLFKGRRVSEVDLNKKEIVTIKRGEPVIRYKHPDSFDNYGTLDYLQEMVSFENISLKQIIKFSNEEVL
jgi:hypothetical protein